MSALDDLSPKTQLNFPDGATLTIGTRCDNDDPTLYDVHLVYDSPFSPEEGMEIAIPPHSVDVLVSVLQKVANEARFIMGQEQLDYPPIPSASAPKKQTKKTPKK